MPSSAQKVDAVRAASRRLVRELGFTGRNFAGTTLSPSAVHALIEIERGQTTARDLSSILFMEKSSVSRMVRKLVEAGDVAEQAGEEDGRMKRLSLTEGGRARVGAIHAFARAQVSGALERLSEEQRRTVLDGLRLYGEALAGTLAAPVVVVERGYRPGLLGRITELHALAYAKLAGFGRAFEVVVAGGLADFLNRPDGPDNAIWTAMQGGSVVGSIAIDGEDLGAGIAHLRWFVVDEAVRGSGAGKNLLDAALAFVDGRDFSETQLWTFSGLDAARHLYETRGFRLAEERPGTQWGSKVLEQRFVRPSPRSAG